MKELIETVIVALFLILATFIVVSCKGTDTMDWNEFGIKLEVEEEFNYPVDSTCSANGQYRRVASDATYILFGKNLDGTYRVYFIKIIAGVKNVVLRVDNLRINDVNGVLISDEFRTTDNESLKLTVTTTQQIIVQSGESGLGNASLQGNYKYMKGITAFTLNQVEKFNG